MIPKTTDNLIRFATCMANGLETHGLWLGVGEDSVRNVRVRLNDLQRAIDTLATARNTRTMASKRIGLADKSLRRWLGKARLVVMLARGARWSRAWIDTGFTSPAMRVPKKPEARISLARTLVSFFARHPEFGVGFAEITAARGRATYERVIQSGQMFELAREDCTVAMRERDIAEENLRCILRTVVSWLKTNLHRADSRWSDFGVPPLGSRKPDGRRSHQVEARPIEFVPPPEKPSHSVAAA